MDSHNCRQSNWEVNIYGKKLRAKRSNREPESREFESYTILTCEGSLITLIQPSRLLIFKDELQVPLTVELPCYMNNPKAILHENYSSYITVLGNSTKVAKAYHGITKHVGRSKPYAFNQLVKHVFSLAPCAKQKKNRASIDLTRCLMPESCIRISGIIIHILQNEEQESCYSRRDVITGIKKLEKLAERNGIQAKEMWNNLWKEIKSGRIRLRVQLLHSIDQEVLAIEATGNQFITLVAGDWVRYDNYGASSEVPKQMVESDDKIGSIISCFNDSGPAAHPGCRITNIYSEYSLMGNRNQIGLPYTNCLQSNDTSFMATSIFTPQRIKHMLWQINISAIPNALVPTGLICKSYHKDLIKYCNDLRKSGSSKQLEKILSHFFIKYSHNFDAQLSLGLSKAFALISEDKDRAEKYLSHLLDVVWKTKNALLFLGRIHLYMGYLNLLRKHSTTALDELAKAAYYLQNFQAGELKAWLCYLRGVLYKISAEEGKLLNADWEQKSLKYFDLYLQHVKIEEKDGFFAHKGVNVVMLKKANINLMVCEKMEIAKNFKMATGALDEAKGCLKFLESSKVGVGREGNAEYNSLLAEIAEKEISIPIERDVLIASVSHFKNNPDSFVLAEKELQSKLQELENGKKEQM